MRTLDFRDHRRELLSNRYVYAVVSRRAQGLSIGINLNPDKVCNFDCPYCQVDRTTPGGPREVDPDRLEAELDHLLGLIASGELWALAPFNTAAPEHRQVRDIAIAGDGEPTTCATLGEAVERIGSLRATYGLEGADAPALTLLTNATMLHRAKVARAVDRFHALGGVVWGKLDAGTEAYFQVVDGTRLPLGRVLENLQLAAQRWRLVLQCMFLTLDGVGPTDAEVHAWVERIRAIRACGPIDHVQVYSVARRPAEDRVGCLPTPRLTWIAEQARALGVEVRVYPGLPEVG